jgi:succinyl-CoA synthetase beta subunit
LFAANIHNQHVQSILLEEAVDALEEQYLSISYDTSLRQPVLVYSTAGGVDIEEVAEEHITRIPLDVRSKTLPDSAADIPYAQELWTCFLQEDARVVEINPLIKQTNATYIAADAKVALDDDAQFRHKNWEHFPARSMMGREPTALEQAAAELDGGVDYYRGTASKYIELDGDIAVLFAGGGASVSNMDAMISHGLQPANYTEYSGNPPREKVAALARVVLSKPGLRGLWIAGGVSNFTSVKETFLGIIDVLDEVRPTYPIVVRRDGVEAEEGFALMQACAERNGLDVYLFDKSVGMGETAHTLATIIKNTTT